MICYYCEINQATKTRFGKFICDKCNQIEIRGLANRKISEEEKAEFLRIFTETIDIYMEQSSLKGE